MRVRKATRGGNQRGGARSKSRLDPMIMNSWSANKFRGGVVSLSRKHSAVAEFVRIPRRHVRRLNSHEFSYVEDLGVRGFRKAFDSRRDRVERALELS